MADCQDCKKTVMKVWFGPQMNGVEIWTDKTLSAELVKTFEKLADKYKPKWVDTKNKNDHYTG